MRLSEIKKIIEENKDLLNFTMEGHPKDGNLRIVTGVQSILQAIHNLKAINSLFPIIAQLESVPEVSSIYTNNKATVTLGNANNFNAYLSSLKIQCDTILNLANDILPSIDKDTICIKLPIETDLKMLSNMSTNFSSFFDVLLSSKNNIEGKISFAGVESGSAWVNIAISGSPIFLLLVPEIIHIIYKGYYFYITRKRVQFENKQLEIKTGTKEDLKELHKAFCKKCLEELNNSKDMKLDFETIGKLTNNIVSLSLLLGDGMEIHPAITAPTKTQTIANEKIDQLKEQIEELKLLEAPQEPDNGTSSGKDEDDGPTDGQN